MIEHEKLYYNSTTLAMIMGVICLNAMIVVRFFTTVRMRIFKELVRELLGAG